MNDSVRDERDVAIKSMGLYHHVDRVVNELRELGKAEGEPLQVNDLTSFDQLHYHGTDAVDEAIRMMGIGAESSVLEIGSGFGGPARHLAAASGAAVTALELQEDHHLMAVNLTLRCGLADRVSHVCGDFLTHPLDGTRFDAIASWLALYHIPGRGVLLDRCRTLLADSGFFYAEDLYERRPFDGTERARLSSELFANELTSSDRYRRDLVEAGFEVVVMDDMTDDWTAFTEIRLAEYVAQRERHLRVHGDAVFETMCGFYETMVRLFAGGKLGGIRVVARRG